MVECKSQASFTARRLVGQIRTMETTGTTTSRPSQRIRGQTTTATTLVALPPTMISSKHLQRRQNNHTFSYTFSPNSLEQAAGDRDNDSSDEQYLEEIEFEINSNRGGGGGLEGDESGSNCKVSIGGNGDEDGQLSVATCQDHGRRRQQQQQQPSLGRHCLTEGQECCLANFGGQNSEKSRKINERNINNKNNNKIFSPNEIDEQQQTEDFSSEDNQDLNSSSSSINNNTHINSSNNKMWKITRKNKSKKLQAFQSSSKLSPISLKSASKISSPSQQQQQHQQNFVRCSGINIGFKARVSSIRRSKRGSKRAQKRQVRFEPKPPETINISATTFESDDNSFKTTTTTTTASQNSEEEEEEENSREENEYVDENFLKENNNNKSMTTTGDEGLVIKEPLVVRYSSSSNNSCGEKTKKIPQYLSAAKPFTRRLHHLSHNIKFSKIKLKSFNNLAHQLHQTLSNSTSNFAPDNRTNNNLRKLNKQQQNSSHYNNQTSTATGGRHFNGGEQQIANGGEDEDFGWGSDFDEQSADSSLTSQQQQDFKDHSSGLATEKQGSGSGGGYLLEIGKSSCDFRAIEDVIQDQGTSGQFKRLDLSHHEMSSSFGRVESAASSSSLDSSLVVKGSDNQIIGQNRYDNADNNNHKVFESEKEKNNDDGEKVNKENDVDQDEVEVEEGEEEEDDEAELRSLEARQGFKQIRDKLKVILDQRLANYEKSVVQTDESTDESVINKTSDGSKKVSDDIKNNSSRSQFNKQKMVINEPNKQISSTNLLVSTQTSSTCSPSKDSSSSLKIVTSSTPTSVDDDASPTSSPTVTITTTNSALVSPSTSTSITSPSKSTTTTTNATSTTTTTSANNGCTEFEDCQSHCSDESSSSSVGLDSNHSSGQDSGHSTQHSGYSTTLSVMHRHHHHSHNDRHDCHDNHHRFDHHRHHTIVCDDGELVDERAVVEGSPVLSNGTLSVSPTCDTQNDEHKSPTVSSTPPLSSSAYSSSSSPSHTIKDGDTEMGSPKQTHLNPTNKFNNDKLKVLDPSDETNEERRNRFLQNRSIINDKLESMFRSRSSGALSSPPKQSSPKQFVESKQEQTFIQKQQQQQQQHQPNKITTMAKALPDTAKIDSETRIKLLEQQRQISLKLKQKPRRKSAKRAFMINNQCLDSNNATPNTEEDNGSYSSNCNPNYNERFSVIAHHYNNNNNNNNRNNKLVIPNTCTGTIRHNNYESLTKQLSMICLRQAGSQLAVFQNSQKPLDKHHHLGTSSCATDSNWDERVTTGVAGGSGGLSSSSKHISTATTANFNTLNLRNHSNHHQQQQPKAAMSLRQLVKDVIDDCEKPNKLSSLTISILNRSDSFSSDLATLSADEAITPSEQQQQQQQQQTTTLVATNLNDSDQNINGREIDEEQENVESHNPSFNDSITNYQRSRHFYQRENHRYYHSNYVSPTSSVSLSSIPNTAASTGMACLSSPVANQDETKGDKCMSSMNRAMAVEPIGYMVHPIPLPTTSMKSTNHHQHNQNHHHHHHSGNSNQHYDHYNHHDHHQQQEQHHHLQQQQQVATADQSISSIGSIDGLEYSRATTSSGYSNSELCLQSAHNLDETAGVISNGQLTNTVIGFGKMQKSTIGSYLKSLRELSRFKKMPKVKLINGNCAGSNNSNSNTNNKLSGNQHHQFDHNSDHAIATVNSNTILFGTQTNPSTSTVGHHNKIPPSSHYEFYNDVNFY